MASSTVARGGGPAGGLASNCGWLGQNGPRGSRCRRDRRGSGSPGRLLAFPTRRPQRTALGRPALCCRILAFGPRMRGRSRRRKQSCRRAGSGYPVDDGGPRGSLAGTRSRDAGRSAPLFACLTPWLVRKGFTAEDPPEAAPQLPGPIGADNLTPGDAVEIAGLAICAGGLGLLLAIAPGHQLLAGWQMWGAPLLLIVWASLRQGLRGGTVVACAAVAVPLAVLAIGPTHAPLSLLLQGNLLAQAGTGLLVAASASWLR